MRPTRRERIAPVRRLCVSLVSMLAVAVAYAHLRELRPVEGLLFGVRAAALATVAQALVASARLDLQQRRRMAIAAGAFLAMFVFAVSVPLVLMAAAAVGVAADALAPRRDSIPVAKAARPPLALARTAQELAMGLGAWIAPLGILAVALGSQHMLARESLFFAKASVVVVGGPHAVLAYAAQPIDGAPPWVTPGDMLDALGLALAIPGPAIQVVSLLGFLAAWRDPASWPPLLAGVVGAGVATWATCGPGLALHFAAAPLRDSLRGVRRVEAAHAGVQAGRTGVLLGLALWLALHLLFAGLRTWQGAWGARGIVPRWWSLDLSALVLTALACVALARWRWGTRATLLRCAGIGLLLRWALGVL